MYAKQEENKVKKYSELPKVFEKENGQIKPNFRNASQEVYNEEGFYDIENPIYDKKTKKLGELEIFEDEKIARYKIIDKTVEELQLNKLQQIKQTYQQRKSDGWEAYQNFRAQVVTDIANGKIIEAQAFAIEEILGVAYNKISASGDWKTAHYKLTQVVIPQGYEFVQPYYNEALQEIETYIAANYE